MEPLSPPRNAPATPTVVREESTTGCHRKTARSARTREEGRAKLALALAIYPDRQCLAPVTFNSHTLVGGSFSATRRIQRPLGRVPCSWRSEPLPGLDTGPVVADLADCGGRISARQFLRCGIMHPRPFQTALAEMTGLPRHFFLLDAASLILDPLASPLRHPRA